MGTAWVAGIVRGGVLNAEDVTGVDPKPKAVEDFVRITRARAGVSLADLAGSDVVLLCTKPHDVRLALRELAGVSAGRGMLVISIAAGVTLQLLEEWASESLRVIRAMPNTPALVGEGASAFCVGKRATREDAACAGLLLGKVGLAMEVPESLMDAVTGLSGSGPAYVYLMIEAMADGGVRCGLPREQALSLAAQTVLGAARMVMETGEHPAHLKDMVTSPGGTTIAGLAAMESAGVRSAMIEAVSAATRRARELAG